MNPVDLKVVLLGHEAVGKTSLMKRLVNDTFNNEMGYQNTIGSAFAAKELQIQDKKLVLGIWDTAGSERYISMTSVYYRGAAAAIICYDITNPETFARAKFWLSELRNVEENCSVYLCGTKKDLLNPPLSISANPEISTVEDYAASICAKFFLTSSKTGENVAEMFKAVAEDFTLNPINKSKLNHFITLNEDRKQSTKCCFL